MPRVLSLFVGLALLLSMGVSAAAHMSEQLCTTTVESAAFEAGHADRDGDPAPTDKENGYPHHHGGCHGHHVAMTPSADGQAAVVSLASMLNPDSVSAVAGYLPDSALRPPIA